MNISSSNNSFNEFDQGLIDDNVQLTSAVPNGGASYAAAILDPFAAGWDLLADVPDKNLDSKDYGDVLAIEDYKLPYTDVISLDNLESTSRRESTTNTH